MKIVNTKQSLSSLETGWAVTIGNFDGLHAGHRSIVDICSNANAQRGGSGVAVMTFDPHPAAILHPEKAPGVLTPLEYKLYLLQKAGVDCTVILKDSYDLLNLSPQDFVDDFLMTTAGPKVVVEGANFHFGYGRSGNIDTLKELGVDRGFDVIIAEPVQMDFEDDGNQICSSSLTRRFLESGKVDAAAKVIGRNYRLMGTISKGRGVGSKLGYPTANLSAMNQIVPDEGVYAGFVCVGDKIEDIFSNDNLLPAAFSVGRAKTFITEHPVLIEAHILVENIGDIYGKYMAMDFVKLIRPQERFADFELLKKQIEVDCQTALKILSEPRT